MPKFEDKIIKLTGKQEKFCQNIAAGMTNKDAYRNAYDAERMTDQAVNTEANQLLIRDDIIDRIKTLQAPRIAKMQRDSLNARDEQLAFIKSRIDHCLSIGDEQSVIRYTDMINKINGLYKEDQSTTTTKNSMEGLSDAALKKIACIS